MAQPMQAPSKPEIRAWMSIALMLFVMGIVVFFFAVAYVKGTIAINVKGDIDPNLIIGIFIGAAGASSIWIWREKTAGT